jgi:ribosome biogenesis protein ENP2
MCFSIVTFIRLFTPLYVSGILLSMMSGIYPPQVKVYELKELSMKFERHMISEIVDFQVLGDDYSKLAFLCADRSVCLHAKYGRHYSLRIPRMGRDMAYDCWSCDLLCAASSPDVYRINLEQVCFLSSSLICILNIWLP